MTASLSTMTVLVFTFALFDCVKASRSERNAGLEGMDTREIKGAVGMKTVTAAKWGDPDEPVYVKHQSPKPPPHRRANRTDVWTLAAHENANRRGPCSTRS